MSIRRPAKKDLNKAIGEKLEPKNARMHAQEALAALKKGDKATAKMHATNGAGVEHFTYALRALNAGMLTGTGSAEDHLGEASALSKFHKQAAAAIKAIEKKNVKSARKHIKAGLALTNKE